MSLVPGFKNLALDDLIQSSLESEDEDLRLKWIPYEEIRDIKPTQVDNVHYAFRKESSASGSIYETMILLGSSEECTPTLMSEFARIYSLPTHKYNNDVSQYRRYSRWLKKRNKLIKGFTEYDGSYYMVADERFYHCYSRYGFCTACRIFRCSPVWCVCGHKQLCDGWTSNNKQLDEFIKKCQLQTNSANHAYLEWIPFDCIGYYNGYGYLDGLPTPIDQSVKLIPLEITDSTHDLYYAEVNYLLMRHVY